MPLFIPLENFVADLLEKKSIEYIHECSKKDLKWIGKQRLDFYIPSKKLAVECQGLQHFIPSNFNGPSNAEENLKENIKSDIKKFNKCIENGIKVVYVVNNKKDVIDSVIYKYDNVYDKNEFIKLFEK